MEIAQRIATKLKELNKSERQASLEANLSDSFIRNIRLGRSKNPRGDTLKRLATVLETNVEWLLGIESEQIIEKANAIIRGNFICEPGPTKIPVYGQAKGGDDGAFELNGIKLYDVMCPPSLSNCFGVYAIEISGSSMSPRYEEGEIAYIDPVRPVKRGDYAVVQIRSKSEELHAFIKKYLFKNSKELVMEQFNPAKRLSFPINQVVSIHYVVMSGNCN